MIQPRSNFGCTVNVSSTEIIVAGGYENGVFTRTCEIYSVAENRWRALPTLKKVFIASSITDMYTVLWSNNTFK